MITRFEVKNFRMLRANAVSLMPFVVLVGKNATGKSTLIGALRFVSDLVKGGVSLALSNALEREAPSFPDLCFDRTGPLEFAVELTIDRRRLRYEVRVGPDATGVICVQEEHLYLLPDTNGTTAAANGQLSLWGDFPLMHSSAPAGWRTVVRKTKEGKDYFQDEKTNWNNVFRFGADKAALGAIPEDENRFPLTLKVRNYLRDGVTHVELDGSRLREPSLARSPLRLLPDGSNLARAALALRDRDGVLFEQWVSHVRGAVEGLETIRLWERPEDKKLVLLAGFAGTHADAVPSWLLSDGTLRLLALSLLSYGALEPAGVALIEEPENGLHPLAMQAVYGALSQPPEGGQVLVATHSPVLLAQVTLEQALVFRRQPDGSALVRRGTEVPALREWKSAASIADVFATGVLA
ncbi:MAG: ATP-binding protein [Polyangiaceae bacterium]|nr:ATP-binding protein [Polyangiaceae bacterium]